MFLKKNIFLLFFFVFFFTKLFAQDYVLNYEHLTSQTGLANNFVNCILEDSKGFMWFGTKDGLCRYDGYDYKIYTINEKQNHLLYSNHINSLALFNDSLIYVGTEAGLNLLNINQNTILPIEQFNKQPISQVFIDRKKNIWVISLKQIFHRKKSDKIWSLFLKDDSNFKSKKWLSITEQKVDNQSKIFLTSLNGTKTKVIHTIYELNNDTLKTIFYKSNAYTDTFYKDKLLVTRNAHNFPDSLNIEFRHKDLKLRYIEGNNSQEGRRFVYSFSSIIYNTHLYIPLQKSVLVVDLKTYKVIQEINLTQIQTATQNNIIRDIFIDTKGNLWIATLGEGIFLFPTYMLHSLRGYRHYSSDETKGLSNPSVRAIYKDTLTNTTWISTYSNKEPVNIFWKDSTKKNNPINNYTYTIKEDKTQENILWLGTYEGFWKVDKNKNKVVKRYFSHLDAQVIELNTDSTVIFIDAKNNDVILFNTKQEKFIKKITLLKPVCLYKGKDNEKIWIGTETKGLVSWNITTDKIEYYNPEEKSKISTLFVKSIYQDSRNKLWIATTRGIYYFNEKTNTYKKYDKKNGLPNNVVYGILEDENYNLWLSTNKGISKFNVEEETFENFDVDDGLQDNEYNTYSFFKSKEGELFFGGIKGVDAFFPKDLKKNKSVPLLYLTSFKKENEKVSLSVTIEKLSSLTFKEAVANTLTFSFVALSYYQSHKNQYAYKIEPINKDWISLENENEITLTNLSAGEYTLRIKGSNNHGVWNEKGISLKLHIIPPFHKTIPFYSLSALFFIGIGYVAFRYRIYQLKKKEQFLEQLIKERTQELAKANQTKDRLFAIVAHDLRSPIAAFQSVSRQIDFFLNKNKLEKIREISTHIDSSAQHLNNLLNNLLNWALTQQEQQIRIEKTTINLYKAVEEILKSHQTISATYDIELKNKIPKDSTIWVDTDTFQTIIRNLISNALKYTPKDGKITLSIASLQDETVILKIQDTGTGISEEIKNKLNSEIIQLDFNHTQRGLHGEKSTGLGLLLCYEFAALNKIKITFESKIDEGTIFYLSIPINPT